MQDVLQIIVEKHKTEIVGLKNSLEKIEKEAQHLSAQFLHRQNSKDFIIAAQSELKNQQERLGKVHESFY